MDINELLKIQNSLASIIDVAQQSSWHWERDSKFRHLTKAGWQHALEDAQSLLVSYKDRCVLLEQAINNINRVLQEEMPSRFV